MIAQVFTDIPSLRLDHYFSYRVPEPLKEQIHPGCRVLVPLGPREVEGFVYRVEDEDDGGLKPVLGVLDRGTPALSPELLELGLWLARRYLCPVNLALKSMIPGALKSRKQVSVTWVGDDLDLVALVDSYPALGGFLDLLSAQGDLPISQARRQVGENVLTMLQESGLIEISSQYEASSRSRPRFQVNPDLDPVQVEGWRRRAPRQVQAYFWLREVGEADEEELRQRFKGIKVESLRQRGWIIEAAAAHQPVAGPVLTSQQATALEALAGRRGEVLLHGVTGSGKTEIYLRLIEQQLAAGKSSMVLVPEIGLTEHLVGWFADRLGPALAVWHSRMNQGEKMMVWQRLQKGEARVILGPRSAVFAPLTDLGLIIIDEEQEPSFKQEENPRYHAAEVARWRALYHQALLVYGSATPSLETYYRAQRGEIALIRLSERVARRPLPRIEVVDMRQEIPAGNRTMFSRLLQEELRMVLERGEQAIIFLNRRGFARFVMCRSCGYRVECPHCSVTMAYHQTSAQMVCHYCGATAHYPQVCPICGSKYIRQFGTGTERVEEELRHLYPKARVSRMDLDTTRGKHGHRAIIEAMRQREVDILVGTQMVAKGFDFPAVSLVGVLAADGLLNLPDFRSGERAYQLLVQVAGRAGRGDTPGRVIIQTYEPQHPVLEHIIKQDYGGFFNDEIQEREKLGYPPVGRVVRVVAWAEDRLLARQLIEQARQRAQEYLQEQSAPIEILGPAPCPIFRLRGQYRYGMTLKGQDMSLLLGAGKYIIEGKKVEGRLEVDVDPLIMY